MRVHIICRLNQARSVLATALIRKLYPEFEVYSAGTQAKTGEVVPRQIVDLAKRWGLDELDEVSMNLMSSEPIREDDIVLAADSLILNFLKRREIPGKLVDVTEFALSKFLSPIDPASMPLEQLEIELAKMAIATVRAIRVSTAQAPSPPIIAFISDFSDQGVSQGFVDSWIEQNSGVAIDMNWHIPDPQFWNSGNSYKEAFNPKSISSFEATRLKKGFLLYSEFEIDNQIEILTHKSWRDFLSKFNRPVLLIINHSRTFSAPENYFAMIHSDRVESINS